ncbi:MAG TPA: hypothetical protein VJM34_16245 [Novosphingobium sp.]|nr:hypothetical protein [Novosphingobium sp.]
MTLGTGTVPAAAPAAVETGLVPPAVDPDGDTFDLEVSRDTLIGTAGGDLFSADVVQNGLGEQTNTLGSGDRLDGRGGTDTLFAGVQDASPLNTEAAGAINPITVDVEVAHFMAENNFELGEDIDPDTYLGVEINATRMWGLDEVGSVDSEGSLTIYNLKTLTDSGVYESRRVTESITVRMDHTGNDSPVNPAANLTVLFDQDYLLASPPQEAGSSLTLQLLDIDNEILSGQPLLTNPFDALRFGVTVGGVRTPITINFGADAKSNLMGVAAYQNLVDAINDNFFLQGLGDRFSASLSTEYSVVDPDGDPGGSAQGFEIIITNLGEGTLDADPLLGSGFLASGVVTPNTDYAKEVFLTPPDTTPEFITVDVALEKVGRGADGGDLTIGGMGTDLDNVLLGRDDVLGVEQFDVTVSGDDTQDSSLASLQSTNNFLRFVYVESAEGTNPNNAADLIIGNSNTSNGENGPLFNIGSAGFNPFDVTTVRNNGLKDVLIFDTNGASEEGVGEFLGDVTVNAYFSQELREKYLDQTDTDPNHQLDDMNAVYTTGSGDDTVNLAINNLNFTSQGTVTRDDFSVSVFTNDGDDHVQFQIGDGDSLDREATDEELPVVENWYHNHVLSDNVTIVTGAGDDFVESWGASAARIFTGTGNDLIYTDNSGEVEGIKPNFEFTDDIAEGYHATWVFNAQNDELSNLQSEGPLNYTNVANVRLTVTYLGIETTVDVGATRGNLGGNISDLTINQAIKAAINTPGSPFEGLLIAEDGPARTLIVRSVTDGQRYENDLIVDIFSDALTAAQTTAGVADVIEDFGSFATLEGRYDDDFASYFGNTTDGNASNTLNNDRVNAGLGNDTTVFSTNEDSVEHYEIDTATFGEDILLNFEAAVEVATENESQTVTISTEDDVIGDGTLVVNFFGFEVEVPFADGDSEATLLDNVEDAIQDAIDDGDIPGTLVRTGNQFTVTADPTDGTNYPGPSVVIEEGGAPEVQTVDFDGTLSTGQVVSISFGSLPTASYTVLAGDDLADLVTGLQTSLSNQGVPVTGTGDLVDIDPLTGEITLTNSVGGDIGPAVVTIQTTGTNLLDATVSTDEDGEGAGISFSTSSIDGDVAELSGWDIFDLTATPVLNGSVQAFLNDVTDGAEQADMASRNWAQRNVLIIDEYTSGDHGSALSGEAARLQAYLRTIDPAGGPAANSVIITVDEDDDNLGRFYLVKDGTGAQDVTVTYMGSVEFGDHADPGTGGPNGDLDNIGEWTLLTIENFQPLTPAQLATDTFQVA